MSVVAECGRASEPDAAWLACLPRRRRPGGHVLSGVRRTGVWGPRIGPPRLSERGGGVISVLHEEAFGMLAAMAEKTGRAGRA